MTGSGFPGSRTENGCESGTSAGKCRGRRLDGESFRDLPGSRTGNEALRVSFPAAVRADRAAVTSAAGRVGTQKTPTPRERGLTVLDGFSRFPWSSQFFMEARPTDGKPVEGFRKRLPRGVSVKCLHGIVLPKKGESLQGTDSFRGCLLGECVPLRGAGSFLFRAREGLKENAPFLGTEPVVRGTTGGDGPAGVAGRSRR